MSKRTLLIMRHAKSSWDDMHLSDHERPLNKRGKHDAPMMGERLKEERYACDLIISSSAKRAHTTAKAVAAALGYAKEDIRIEPTLYMASIEDYLRVIATVDEDINHLMIVSHNPGSEEIIDYLTHQTFEKFPTAAYALLEVEGSWDDMQSVKMVRYDYPKSIVSE